MGTEQVSKISTTTSGNKITVTKSVTENGKETKSSITIMDSNNNGKFDRGETVTKDDNFSIFSKRDLGNYAAALDVDSKPEVENTSSNLNPAVSTPTTFAPSGYNPYTAGCNPLTPFVTDGLAAPYGTIAVNSNPVDGAYVNNFCNIYTGRFNALWAGDTTAALFSVSALTNEMITDGMNMLSEIYMPKKATTTTPAVSTGVDAKGDPAKAAEAASVQNKADGAGEEMSQAEKDKFIKNSAEMLGKVNNLKLKPEGTDVVVSGGKIKFGNASGAKDAEGEPKKDVKLTAEQYAKIKELNKLLVQTELALVEAKKTLAKEDKIAKQIESLGIISPYGQGTGTLTESTKLVKLENAVNARKAEINKIKAQIKLVETTSTEQYTDDEVQLKDLRAKLKIAEKEKNKARSEVLMDAIAAYEANMKDYNQNNTLGK